MPNLKFDFYRHICAAGQSLVRALPLGGAPLLCGLTYLSKAARGDIRSLLSYDFFDIWQDKILYILDTTILILYRKLYINIVSIIVLNIEARQYNVK